MTEIANMVTPRVPRSVTRRASWPTPFGSNIYRHPRRDVSLHSDSYLDCDLFVEWENKIVLITIVLLNLHGSGARP